MGIAHRSMWSLCIISSRLKIIDRRAANFVPIYFSKDLLHTSFVEGPLKSFASRFIPGATAFLPSNRALTMRLYAQLISLFMDANLEVYQSNSHTMEGNIKYSKVRFFSIL